MEYEIRVKQTLNSLITNVVNEPELDTVRKWVGKASMVYVNTPLVLKEEIGITPTITKGFLREAIGGHLMRFKGREVVGFGLPNFELNDLDPLFQKVIDDKLQVLWAFHGGGSLPKFFVIVADMLPHLQYQVPYNLSFSGTEWAEWMHTTLMKQMPAGRYLSMDSMNVVRPVSKMPTESVLSHATALEAPVDTKVATKKRKPLKRLKK